MKKYLILHSGKPVCKEVANRIAALAEEEAAKAAQRAAEEAAEDIAAEAAELAEEECGYSAAVMEFHDGRKVTTGEGNVDVKFSVHFPKA